MVKRGLKEEWRGYLRTDYEFSMAVCRSLASDIEVFVNEVGPERRAVVLGQLNHASPGVKTDEMGFKTVKLTLFTLDDVEDAKKSQKEIVGCIGPRE